ncbi:MAG: hypothetical protein ACREHV_04815, partial [Rhizomicrobium sp.]
MKIFSNGNRFRKLSCTASLPIALGLLASGCAHRDGAPATNASATATHVAQAPSAPPSASAAPAQEHLDLAVELLQKGEAAQAKLELKRYLSDVPDSRPAKFLLAQIETPLSVLYPKENFSIVLGKNDTLSGLASTWLGEPLAFYGLARYNDIASPAKIVAGQSIRIPKTAAAIVAQAAQAAEAHTAVSDIAAPATAPAAAPETLQPFDPGADYKVLFRSAVADGRYVDAAKAADAGNLSPASAGAAVLADAYLRAATLEKETDPGSADAHAGKAGGLY